jgi:hypothetical protein
MRAVVARVVRYFDLKTTEGFNLDDWVKSLVDMFIMKKRPLPVALNTFRLQRVTLSLHRSATVVIDVNRYDKTQIVFILLSQTAKHLYKFLPQFQTSPQFISDFHNKFLVARFNIMLKRFKVTGGIKECVFNHFSMVR